MQVQLISDLEPVHSRSGSWILASGISGLAVACEIYISQDETHPVFRVFFSKYESGDSRAPVPSPPMGNYIDRIILTTTGCELPLVPLIGELNELMDYKTFVGLQDTPFKDGENQWRVIS